jgi:hypothetical protein
LGRIPPDHYDDDHDDDHHDDEHDWLSSMMSMTANIP